METSTIAPTITLDVFSDATSLRQRLRERNAATVASLLPGGLILEDAPEALTYRLGAVGGWQLVESGETVRLVSAEGHELTVRDGHLTLAIAK